MATRDEIIRLLIETAGEDQVEALGKALHSLEEDAAGGGAAAARLASELDKLAIATKAAGDMVALKAAIADTESKLESARDKLAALNTTYDESARASKSVAREFLAAERSIAQLEGQLTKQNLALQSMGGALSKAGVDVTKLVEEEQRLRAEALKAAEALAHNERVTEANAKAAASNAAALRQMGDAFTAARDKVSDIATRLTAAGAAAAAAAGAFAVYKTGEFFSGAIKSAAEFESQISSISAVSGASGRELDMLRETARQAALDTGESFEAVTNTLGDLARAVGDAQRAAEMLAPALNLSTAGGLEAAQAAEILTTTLTQFGLAATESVRVADLLAYGANATTASVEQLGNSMSYAAPLARQLNMSVEETTAAIGALADEGFRGERAGTALRNVMSLLADPASAFNAELAKLGIETRNFNEVIDQLAAAGERSQDALLSLDAAARPAITALVNSGGEGIQRLVAGFETMSVTAASAAAVMRDNLNGAADQAARAWESLRQQLVEPLLGPLAAELQSVGVALREFAQSPEFAQIQAALAGMFEAGIAGARQFVGEIDWAGLAAQVENFATDASDKLADFSRTAGESIAGIREVLNSFGVVIDAVQTGIFGIAAALAKVGEVSAEMAALYLEIQRINPMAQAVAKSIGVDIGAAIDDLNDKAGGLGAVFDEFADRTSSNFVELQNGLARVGEYASAAADSVSNSGAEIGANLDTASESAANLGYTLIEIPDRIDAVAASAAAGGARIAAGLDGGKVSADRLRDAFAALRIESQANLDASAAQAARAFETISAGAREGTASIADARAAFESYARAQLAAVANLDQSASASVESMLRIKGGAIGATEALERLGLVGADAPSRIAPPAEYAAGALDGMADAAARAGSSIEAMGESADEAGARLDNLAASAESVSFSWGVVSDATDEMLRRMSTTRSAFITTSRDATSSMGVVINEVLAQRDALAEANKALDAHIAKYDPLAERLQQLRKQYHHLADADLMILARKQEQLEKLKQQESAQGGVASGARATADAYAEQNKQLTEQQKKLEMLREQNTRRSEITVNFVAAAAKIEFDPSAISDAQWRQVAARVIEIIKRDMQ